MTSAIAMNAQPYLNVGVGYAFPAASEVIDVSRISNVNENIYGSFGKGFNFGAGIGTMFSSYAGAEIGFSYLAGSHYEIHDDALLYTVHGNMLRIIPALKFTIGENVKPYMKFGFIFGLAPEVEIEVEGSQGDNFYSGTEEYSGGSSFGWLATLGADFPASSSVSVFAELNLVSQSYIPEKFESVITRTNGSVAITTVDSRVLVDEVPDNSSGQSLAPVMPFSSFGVNAGIRIGFGSKE